MANQPNPLEAIKDFLQADADVLASVGANKVFGAELPEDETANMPQKCLVVSAVGGPPDRGFIRIQTIRVDIKGYGETPFEAWEPFLAAKNALKAMVRSVQGTVLIHDGTIMGGPLQIRDNDQEWPLVMGSFDVTVSEVATA